MIDDIPDIGDDEARAIATQREVEHAFLLTIPIPSISTTASAVAAAQAARRRGSAFVGGSSSLSSLPSSTSPLHAPQSLLSATSPPGNRSPRSSSSSPSSLSATSSPVNGSGVSVSFLASYTCDRERMHEVAKRLSGKGNALTKDLAGDLSLRAIGCAIFKRPISANVVAINDSKHGDGMIDNKRNIVEMYMRAHNSKGLSTLMEIMRAYHSQHGITIIHPIDDKTMSLTLSLPIHRVDQWSSTILEHICKFMKAQIDDMSNIRQQYSDMYLRAQSIIDGHDGATPVIMHFDRMFERLNRWFAVILT
jgi:hypothetical protein